ncbi:hypothetical protein PR048_026506 [Dryococelus australis]|uniref:DDE Tnp4 domain-containing protein n=1 Tax=Dryococelus australis TaxID=614101 RepID=A0ABQ9GLJ5_9NEOP|nr:hypothetical protein PR048_026506 [Dryococelus australis]
MHSRFLQYVLRLLKYFLQIVKECRETRCGNAWVRSFRATNTAEILDAALLFCPRSCGGCSDPEELLPGLHVGVSGRYRKMNNRAKKFRQDFNRDGISLNVWEQWTVNIYYIDVRANGQMNDANIFRNCDFFTAFDEDKFQIPQGGIFVADDAIPLRVDILKPCTRCGTLCIEQSIFNFRLSRARRTAENAFGILVSRFRIFERALDVRVDTTDRIVKATEDHEQGSTILGGWRLLPCATGLIEDVFQEHDTRMMQNCYTTDISNICLQTVQFHGNVK